MRAFLAALTFLSMTTTLAAAQSEAPDFWFVAVAEDSAGVPQAAVFMDANSITTVDASTRRGVTIAFIPPNASNSLADISFMRSVKEFDCAGSRMRDLEMSATYRDSRGTRSFGSSDWREAAPESSGGVALSFACATASERAESTVFYQLNGTSPEYAAQAIFEGSERRRQGQR